MINIIFDWIEQLNHKIASDDIHSSFSMTNDTNDFEMVIYEEIVGFINHKGKHETDIDSQFFGSLNDYLNFHEPNLYDRYEEIKCQMRGAPDSIY